MDFTNDQQEKFSINEYFAAHPEMMLGEMRLAGGMYRTDEPMLDRTAVNLVKRWRRPLSGCRKTFTRPTLNQVAEPTFDQTIPAPDYIKPNAYCVHEDAFASGRRMS